MVPLNNVTYLFVITICHRLSVILQYLFNQLIIKVNETILYMAP